MASFGLLDPDVMHERTGILAHQVPQVVALTSQKGGSGKTTLTGHLAVQAHRCGNGDVAVIDTDPQGSIAAWGRARAADRPRVFTAAPHQLAACIAQLCADGTNLIFVDTPPAVTDHIDGVVKLADLVLIPTRPSPHDLRAVGATVDIVERHRKAMVFVVNSATRGARITADAAVALSQHGTVAPVTIHNRIDYASSMIDGRTVMEVADESRSAKEVVALWDYVAERLSRLRVEAAANLKTPVLTHGGTTMMGAVNPSGEPIRRFGRRSTDLPHAVPASQTLPAPRPDTTGGAA